MTTKKMIVWVAVVVVAGLGLFWLCHGDKPAEGSAVARIQRGIGEGKTEYRNLEIEKMANLARDLRVLAKRYTANGENRKAHRAIGAAQELDKKIKKLQAENAK